MFQYKKTILYTCIFVFFAALVFICFKDIFNSYFEADEWFHFTHYLPLTHQHDGFIKTLISTIADTNELSRGQHIVPIGEEIFFLNTLLFGLHFTPYAAMSLFLHSLNSFLVFVFIKSLLRNKKETTKSFFIALLGGIFFALAPTPMHAVTWAAFYGQNVLSVTFFLLCIISFKYSLIHKRKNLLFLAFILLILDLATKETATVLFFILPVMALLEKKTFSKTFLAKIYIGVLICFLSLRFILPLVLEKNTPVPNTNIQSTQTTDTQTIVSSDLSIHKSIKKELLFRAVTFPTRILSQLFFPRQSVLSIVEFITPIIYPLPGDPEELNRSQYRQFFFHGPGNDLMIYILSIVMYIVTGMLLRHLHNNKKEEQFQTIIMGLTIIIFATFPLVLIVLSFPRWGYDTYFDSRHYYMPTVGAAMLFPFLILAIAERAAIWIRTITRIKIAASLFVALLLSGWFIMNMHIFYENLQLLTKVIGYPRQQVINQLRQQLPQLQKKTVFLMETDGKGAYGPLLPFQTSIPQVISVVYYDRSPLPESFYNSFILDAKPEGYQYNNGRGFGYFTSRQSLTDALLKKQFNLTDVYSFYYDSQKIKLTDTTVFTRKSLQSFLQEREQLNDWQIRQATTAAENITIVFPPQTEIEENPSATNDATVLTDLSVNNVQLNGNIKLLRITPALDITEMANILTKTNTSTFPVSKRIYLDPYHFNDILLATTSAGTIYFTKLNDILLVATNTNLQEESISLWEKIIGSITVNKK